MVFLQCDGKCWRYQKDKAGVMHILWECDILRAFWSQVHHRMQSRMGKELLWTPRVML